MRFVHFMGLGLVLAIASTSASAFQEQQSGGGAPPPAAAAPVAPEAAPAAPGSSAAPDLGYTTSQGDAAASAGTEVRIPGLGKLGVLPKMDFGLELLYGASEAKQPEPERESPADDLTVRGTIKHNF